MDYSKIPDSGPERWRVLGKYFGYPQCCIDEFCDPNIKNSDKFDVDPNCNGFVPCYNHAQQVREGKIKLEDLIENRECKTLYPEDGF